MKEVLKKIIPDRLIKLYHSERKHSLKKLRNIPEDERVHFDSTTVNAGHFNVKYRGISAIKCPFDYVMYQMIISELKPDRPYGNNGGRNDTLHRYRKENR